MKLNTEEAWLSVERYFPQTDPVNRVYAWQAKQRLAELYREQQSSWKRRCGSIPNSPARTRRSLPRMG